jgi:hypothetical protein
MLSRYGKNWAQCLLVSCAILLAAAYLPPPLKAGGDPAPGAARTVDASPASLQQTQEPFPTEAPSTPPEVLKKQKHELLKWNFEKLKRDADELEALAKSLQEDLGKSNQNVLSLKVVNKAGKIEKLARKIKEAAKG